MASTSVSVQQWKLSCHGKHHDGYSSAVFQIDRWRCCFTFLEGGCARGGRVGTKPEGGKAFHLWFTPQTGDPIDLGALDADGDGNAFVMVSELPAVDQGKAVVLTADAPGSKQPGDVIASAELPKLKPQHAAPASAETPQAKSGNTSQQMHQQESEPAPGK